MSGRRPQASHARPAVSHSETARQWVHILVGLGALSLRYLHWWQAAIVAAAAAVFNIRMLRRLGGASLYRPHELGQDVPAGLVLYPTAVLLLLLLLPSRLDIVAAAWGILAFGDGLATLVGRRFGAAKWPWNRQKSIAGSAALFAGGAIAGACVAWWVRPSVIPPPYVWFSIGAPIVAALAAAAVETVPIRLDDNLTVPVTAAAVMWTLSLVSEDVAIAALRAAPPALAIGLACNALLAAGAYAARTISKSGAVTGAVIGVVIFVAAGWQGWVLLLAAFGCAAATSRLGLERKVLLGIEEPHEGRRGPGNAIANTGVAAFAAFAAATSYAPLPALIAFTAAMTAGASDTVASEIGKAWGRRTFSIVPFRPVPPGTSGAVSLEGTAAGLVSAAAMATLAIGLGLIPGPALLAVVAGATIGSIVEGLLGATFEPTGVLNNDALNVVNTAVAAFAAVAIASFTS